LINLSNEAIQDISGVYSNDNLKVTNATITGSLKTGSLNLLPRGSIIMWYGTEVPEGWILCDGTNGTPDLRGRFVVGTGQGSGLTNRNLNDKGGEEMHALTVNEMPSHNHQYFDSFWIENFDFFNKKFGGKGISQNNDFGGNLFGNGADYDTDNNVIGYNTNTKNNGGSQPHNNMPPFYALTFIMKT
jgi:microcystin-dependent protein